MGLGDAAIGEETLGTDQVDAWSGLRYWAYVDHALLDAVLMDSMVIEEDESGNSRASCRIVNPDVEITAGHRLEIVYEDSVVFGGVIRTLDIEPNPSGTLQTYLLDAEGWDFILRRRFISKRYTNSRAGDILRDALSVSGVTADEIVLGPNDRGPNIILADAVNQRMAEFVRDVASAGGGFAFVDPNRRLTFQSTSLPYSSVPVTAERAETLSYTEDLDNYRNRQIVKVTGLDGTTTVTETRDDLVEQVMRAGNEGGSGIYEMYEEVEHTTSSVVGDLSIMGQTVGYLALRTYGRNVKRLKLRMRALAPRVREIVQVDLPLLGLLGPFSVVSRRISDLAGELLYEVELIEGGFSQDALESLLKIVGAARTTVSIDASLFPNSQVFSTAGNHVFVIPAGVFTVQLTAVGGSGGGGGGVKHTDSLFGIRYANGGTGGASGKAVSIVTVTPAESLDIVVGAAGTQGANATATSPSYPTATGGSTGGNSQAKRGVTVLAQGDGSAGGGGASIDNSPPVLINHGANGADAGGLGDAISVGGGQPGGVRGTGNPYVQPLAGQVGFVEVRW